MGEHGHRLGQGERAKKLLIRLRENLTNEARFGEKKRHPRDKAQTRKQQEVTKKVSKKKRKPTSILNRAHRKG